MSVTSTDLPHPRRPINKTVEPSLICLMSNFFNSSFIVATPATKPCQKKQHEKTHNQPQLSRVIPSTRKRTLYGGNITFMKGPIRCIDPLEIAIKCLKIEIYYRMKTRSLHDGCMFTKRNSLIKCLTTWLFSWLL